MITSLDMRADTGPEVTARTHPVRMGVVGANFGSGIARNLARGNHFVELGGVCDHDLTKATDLAGELGVGQYASLDEMLEDPEIEAVGLFTPPVRRAVLIHKILAHGRHVMTTKPFELELEGAASVLAEATERGLVIHLNSPAPVPAQDLEQINRWVHTHNLGLPISMRAATWANYREVANGSWYDDPWNCPAAPIFRLGIYFLNDFTFLLGTPTKVHVAQSRVFTGRPTVDNAHLTVEFASGALASIYASFCVDDGDPWRDEVTLHYERGTIRRWIERTGSLDMSGDSAVLELRQSGSPALTARTEPGAFAGWYNWEAFHDAIRGIGSVPKTNSQKVLYGVRLLDAMRRSSLSGAPELVRA